MSEDDILDMMDRAHLRMAHMTGFGNGEWILIDLAGHKVADIPSHVAAHMVETRKVWPTPNPTGRAREKDENELFHLPWTEEPQ